MFVYVVDFRSSRRNERHGDSSMTPHEDFAEPRRSCSGTPYQPSSCLPDQHDASVRYACIDVVDCRQSHQFFIVFTPRYRTTSTPPIFVTDRQEITAGVSFEHQIAFAQWSRAHGASRLGLALLNESKMALTRAKMEASQVKLVVPGVVLLQATTWFDVRAERWRPVQPQDVLHIRFQQRAISSM